MSGFPRARLERHLRVLRELKQQVDSWPADRPVGSQLELISTAARAIEREDAGLLPPFDPDDFRGRFHPSLDRFERTRILAWLTLAIATVTSGLDGLSAAPPPEPRAFAHVLDDRLRRILERDWLEIQKALAAGCWKSAIVLSGSFIEATLLALLRQDPRSATAAAAPRQPDIAHWSLNDLIKVAVELRVVSPVVERLAHAVREYRNLIHPGNEIRHGLTFGAEEARIAVEVLSILHRDVPPLDS